MIIMKKYLSFILTIAVTGNMMLLSACSNAQESGGESNRESEQYTSEVSDDSSVSQTVATNPYLPVPSQQPLSDWFHTEFEFADYKNYISVEKTIVMDENATDIFEQYGRPQGCTEDMRLICCRQSKDLINGAIIGDTSDENYATLSLYDPVTGKTVVLLKEEPEEKRRIDYDFKLLGEDCIYYIRCETQGEAVYSAQLCRINLDGGNNTVIFDYSNAECGNNSIPEAPVRYEGKLYFHDITGFNPETEDFIPVMYTYDEKTGELAKFRDNAEGLIIYKNSAYYLSDKNYYNISTGEKLVNPFDVTGEWLSGFIGCDDVLVYRYVLIDNKYAYGSGLGYLTDDFKPVDAAQTVLSNSFTEIYPYKDNAVLWTPSNMALFDAKKQTFVSVKLDDNKHGKCFVGDDSIAYITFNSNSNDYRLENPILYIMR